MTFNFNLKPNTTTLDLGDSTNKWQNLYVGTIAATTLQAPTTSGGSTLGVGSSGQFLSSNGTSSYWASLPTASTSAAGIIQIGTGATNACAGNDSRLSNSRTPTAHATTSTTYGGGTASNYGHVALTDTYATVSTSQKAANSIAASAWALQTAYTTLNSNITDINNFIPKSISASKVSRLLIRVYKTYNNITLGSDGYTLLDTTSGVVTNYNGNVDSCYLIGITIAGFETANVYNVVRGSSTENIYLLGKPNSTVGYVRVFYFFMNTAPLIYG